MDHLNEAEQKFNKTLEWLAEELATIRTNRPTPKLIENIKVDYFGQEMPIKQVGTILVEAPRDLVVTAWDKNMIAIIAKAIEKENLGLSVAVQGNSVRVTLPELTVERREELRKIARTTAEEARIRMRQQREEYQKKIKELDEDEKFRGKEALQKKVDAFNQSVMELIEKKDKEINE
jgi:ribosome recycling factor